MVEENSRKSLLNTLDKLPFWLEVLALNLVEKTLLIEWKKLAQSPLEILLKNNAQTPKFIGLEKLAVGVWQTCRSTGHLPELGVHVCARRSTGPVDRLQV